MSTPEFPGPNEARLASTNPQYPARFHEFPLADSERMDAVMANLADCDQELVEIFRERYSKKLPSEYAEDMQLAVNDEVKASELVNRIFSDAELSLEERWALRSVLYDRQRDQ